jgi:predicted dehydrogenase
MNIAIVGFGSIGKKHFSILRKIKKIDKILVISKSFKKKLDKKTFIYKKNDDLENINIDAVFICSPASNHLSDINYYLNKNCHIFVEKPIAKSINELKKHYNKLFKFKKNLTIGYPFRFSAAAMNLKKLIKTKQLGKILDIEVACSSFLPNWRNNRHYKEGVSSQKKLGGGVLLELSHELDYILWFFGFPKKIFSFFSKVNVLNIDTEEFVRLVFVYNKFLINIKLCFNDKNNEERYCKIIAINKNIKWNLNDNSLLFYKNNKIQKKIEYKEDKLLLKKEIIEFMKNFKKVSIARNKKNLFNSLMIMKLIEKIHKSKVSLL